MKDTLPGDSPTLTLPVRESAPGARAYLLVFDGNRGELFHLPLHGEVVIGRAQETDLVLKDAAGISRKHARLRCDHGTISIEDLDSHNGTQVNGQPLGAGSHILASGDVVSLGEASLVFHRDADLSCRRSLRSLAEVRERLGEEIGRALRYHCPLCVLCIDFPAPTQGLKWEKLAPLSRALRSMDVVAVCGQQVLVVLPELIAEEAAETATTILAALQSGQGPPRAGLAGFPEDGTDADTLLASAQAAAAAAAPAGLLRAGQASTELQVGEHNILLADAAMLRTYRLIEQLAPADLPVLIHGETGAGKELAAQALHHLSRRRNEPLCTLNCAALPEALVEGELFGYERGAFSGALAAKAGLLESAHRGSVFLDEAGEMSASVQAKLLRVLSTKKVSRLGDLRERPIDIRLIAATNRDLRNEVSAGRFRQDLFFRLSGAQVCLPPLRDRPRELGLLFHRFVRDACAQLGRPVLRPSGDTLHRLRQHRWPGNVRELKNVSEYLAATVPGLVIETWHLPEPLGNPPPAARELPTEQTGSGPSFRPLAEEVRELEKRRMSEALVVSGGVQTRAAMLLAMPLRTFTNKLRLYELPPAVGRGK